MASGVMDIEKRKKKLLDESRQSKERFSNELDDTLKKIQRGALTGLVVSGVVFVGYKFLKNILKPDSETEDNDKETPTDEKDAGEKDLSKKNSRHEENSELKKAVIEMISWVILGIAKNKLEGYLKSLEHSKDEKQ